MKSGIYLIKNIINNKVYIGSASNISKRLSRHKKDLAKGKHHSILLQRAWDKYGEQSFKFELIEKVSNPEHLLAYEQVYLDYYKSYESERGYNICKVAGSGYGIKWSEEAKKKISEIRKAKNRKLNEEVKRKIGQSSKGRNIGRKHSEEEKQKISQANKGRIITEEHRKKLSEAQKRKDHKYYSFNKNKKKYRVKIWGKDIGYYNTEEEAKQAVAENIEKFKIQQIVSQ